MDVTENNTKYTNKPRPTELDIESSVPVAWAVIRVSGGDHNQYAWDAARRQLCLSNVVQYSEQSPVDKGYIPDTSVDGQPVELWLVRSYPVQQGALVETRIIGVLEQVEGTPVSSAACPPVLLGVPIADPHFAAVFEVAHLPGTTWSALVRLTGHSARWGSSDQAADVLRQARRAQRMTRAQGRQATLLDPERPLWKPSIDDVEQGAEGSGGNEHDQKRPATQNETVRYTSAEYAFHKIPQRFQGDLAHCLLPHERILFFAYRPEFRLHRSLLKRERLNEGMVVVTDRQIIWLVDAFPRDATMIQWGYNAHAVVVERLVNASVEERNRHADLVVTVGAAKGVEDLRISFPGAGVPPELLQYARRFLPAPNSKALRRVVQPRVPKRSVRWLKDESDLSFLPPHVQEALRNRRDTLLGAGERVLGDALAAAIPDLGLQGRLVTVTSQRLIENATEGEARIFPIKDISTVQFQHSLWGSSLLITVPGPQLVSHRIRFNSPQQPWFQHLYALLGQCISAPYTRAE